MIKGDATQQVSLWRVVMKNDALLEHSEVALYRDKRRFQAQYSCAHMSGVTEGIAKINDQVIMEKVVVVHVKEQKEQKIVDKLVNDAAAVGQCLCHTLRLLCTPIDLRALVIGALFSEGIICVMEDIFEIVVQENFSDAEFIVFVNVTVKSPCLAAFFAQQQQQYELINQLQSSLLLASPSISQTTASHSLSVDALCHHIKPQCCRCGERDCDSERGKCSFLPISIASIFFLMRTLRARQRVFAVTGAAHAALLFRARCADACEINDGDSKEAGDDVSASDVEFTDDKCVVTALAFAEDIGRHNGIDKVLGKCLSKYREIPENCGLILSSRISFELINKAAHAGVKFIAAVSAPSALAIACAEYYGITLCGFVRQHRINVYTHAWRVIAVTI